MENIEIFKVLCEKSKLKSVVNSNTNSAFIMFKQLASQFSTAYKLKKNENNASECVNVEYLNKGEFEFELQFGDDSLIFMLHSNVFEFSRNHEIMTLPYIKEDKSRSYCGVINIYNFLSDSFKFNRINDIGYLIGRVFINKDMNYFIEGKREIGMLFNNFARSKMNLSEADNILKSAILYAINFDLLTPPYEEVKQVTVFDMQASLENLKIRTGKRLGFKFYSDNVQ